MKILFISYTKDMYVLLFVTLTLKVYNRNHCFGLGLIPKPKTKSADTTTDTATTFQMKSRNRNRMGYFFHHKRVPKIKFAAKSLRFLYRFWRPVFNYKILKTYILLWSMQTWNMLKFLFRKKKSFGSDNNTEIEPWFRVLIPKPSFGHTLQWLNQIMLFVKKLHKSL